MTTSRAQIVIPAATIVIPAKAGIHERIARVRTSALAGLTTLSATRTIPLRRSAFTIVEAVISMVIISTMFVAALSTVGASRLSQYKTSLDHQGRLFAEALMAEILQQSYKDPAGQPGIGPETGESTTTRAAFDDVDDYNGWSATPPTQKDGTVLPNSTNWKQEVIVQWVDPLDPTQVKAAESSSKRITVTISYANRPVCTLVGLRTGSGF